VTQPRLSQGGRADDLKVERTPAEILSATIVELALDSIISIDHEGRIVEFNPAAERTFGYKREEVMGRQMAELIIPPHLRAAHYAGLRRYLTTGEAHVLGRRLELEGQRADGSLIPVELAIVRIPLPGPPVFTSYIRDLTAQRKFTARQRLLLDASAVMASSLEYEQTLRNISRVVIPAMADWYFVEVNDPVTGGTRRIHVDHRDPAKVALAKTLAERYPNTREDRGVRAVLRSGKTEWAREIPDAQLEQIAQSAEHLDLLRTLGLRSYIITPLSAHGQVYGALGFITAESGRRYDEDDVAVAEELGSRAGQAVENARFFRELDQQRELLQEQQTELEAQAAELEEAAQSREAANTALRKANDDLRQRTQEALRAQSEADEANRAKSEFLASMSHELRTPLNAILGYADLLTLGVHGAVNEEQNDRLVRVKRSGQHLLSLINDILNFAKLEAGRVDYKIRTVAVTEVLKAAEEILAPQIGAKQLRYRAQNNCPGGAVCADREKLVQILINLLSNAVRHTGDAGEIALLCDRDGDDIKISVSDTGAGIPTEKLEAIFEPFVQVESAYEGDRHGTGLGLSISRELARAMDGDVTVESKVGVGSTFTVRLPAADKSRKTA
jgi:PAS domain S-box-containing protein